MATNKKEESLVDLETLCQDLKSYCEEMNKIASEINRQNCKVEFKILNSHYLGSQPVDTVIPVVTKVLLSENA